VAGKEHFAQVFPPTTLNGGCGGRLCCKCTLFCYFVQTVLSLIVPKTPTEWDINANEYFRANLNTSNEITDTNNGN
jgi:hypothetical protein